jgi:nucleotide-binding universal stress UspA family protein
MFQSILVAVDPSPARDSALRMAGELAGLANAGVHVLHVVTSQVTWGTVMRLEDDVDGQAILDESLAVLRDMGVKADGSLVGGTTNDVPALIAAAAEASAAELLVLSPHHRNAISALFNPRVSDAVVHASKIAVLLAPDTTE